MAISVNNPPSTAAATGTPTYSATDYTVPANTQMLVALPVQCDGYLIITGDYVEIY